MKRSVMVILGAGGIGVAIGRRLGIGKTVLLADFNAEVLEGAATQLRDAGYVVETQSVDIARRDTVRVLAETAARLGPVEQVVITAGLSPNMASPSRILEVDLYGTAVVFEEFEVVIASGGSGLVISSMAGHMLPALSPEQDAALAFTRADDLLALPFLAPDAVTDSGMAYCLAKRGNALRVKASAMSWGRKGARVNAISPGIIVTPLALHELNSSIGAQYRALIDMSPSGRMAPPDEIAAAAAYIMGSEGTFITGTDLLIDGGVIAAMFEAQQSRNA